MFCNENGNKRGFVVYNTNLTVLHKGGAPIPWLVYYYTPGMTFRRETKDDYQCYDTQINEYFVPAYTARLKIRSTQKTLNLNV